MSALFPERAFAYRGEFAGFVETASGKRRMVLRIDGEEVCFKLPRELRHEYADRLTPGLEVAVAGVERRHLFSGELKRVIERLHLPGGSPACAQCPIRVCSKKNCWKHGGKELWHALETQLAARGLTEVVRLKAVRCLDHCKHAPNLAHGETHYRDCTPALVTQLLDLLAPPTPPAPAPHSR